MNVGEIDKSVSLAFHTVEQNQKISDMTNGSNFQLIKKYLDDQEE